MSDPVVAHDEPPSPTPRHQPAPSHSPSPLLLCLGHTWKGEGGGSAGSLADSAHGHAALPTRACNSTNGALQFGPRHRRLPSNSRLDGDATCSSAAIWLRCSAPLWAVLWACARPPPSRRAQLLSFAGPGAPSHPFLFCAPSSTTCSVDRIDPGRRRAVAPWLSVAFSP